MHSALLEGNRVTCQKPSRMRILAAIVTTMLAVSVCHADEIRLAGAFGSHIDPMYAMVLGMIPDCDLDHVFSAGNAAGSGAMMALLSGAARVEIEELVPRIEKVETAIEPTFQQHFIEAMAIPHATAEYKHLSTRIDLTGIPPADAEMTRTGRRRSGRGVENVSEPT